VIAEGARKELTATLGEQIAFDVPMARHIALRVGGPADAFARPVTRDDLSRLLALCAEQDLPVTLLGSGFNTLVTDGGVEGVVICLKKLRAIEAEGEHAVSAEAGVSHSQVTRFCIDRGLAGLEFGAGIPGTVGGWVAMNAGIGSREVADVVRSIEVVRIAGGDSFRIDRSDLDFGYRALRGLPAGTVIVSARFGVSLAQPEKVKSEVDRLLATRAESQPLNVPSCGSVFKNPKGDYAGRLIEAAGLKGERSGGAQISPVHANFIANTGGATAADVQALIQLAQQEVQRSSGVRLCTEVRIVGRPS
jgi:UDP-N-acetylmuramate dehydrogenase